jgi:hypothetical protein
MMTKTREEFESWAKTTFLRVQLYWSEEHQLYRVFPVQCAWIAWQAAKSEEPSK